MLDNKLSLHRIHSTSDRLRSAVKSLIAFDVERPASHAYKTVFAQPKSLQNRMIVENLRKNNHGFTVVELLISMSVTAILAVAMLGIIMNYFVVITRDNLLVDMTVDSQNLLRATVEELRYGAGVRQTNTISDANGPAGGWNTSNSNFVIIIAMPTLDANNNYIIDDLTGQPYNNEYVYFKSGLILYKRVLANPSAVGNVARTTCPQAVSSPSCRPDRILNDFVKDMNFTLYDQDNVVTADPLLARSVLIDLIMERDTFGAPLNLSNNIQVTLRNNFQ